MDSSDEQFSVEPLCAHCSPLWLTYQEVWNNSNNEISTDIEQTNCVAGALNRRRGRVVVVAERWRPLMLTAYQARCRLESANHLP